MFKMAALMTVLAASFTEYPAFLRPNVVVEAFTDKGLMVELIVRCPVGTGILTYSKVERAYCSSRHACFGALPAAVDHTCGRSGLK